MIVRWAGSECGYRKQRSGLGEITKIVCGVVASYLGIMRNWLKVALVVVVAMGATACSPPVRGVSGFSVDADGHPMIVLAWCDGGTPDVVSVYHHEDEPLSSTSTATVPGDHSASMDGPTRRVEDAEFTAPILQGHSASVRLDAPTDGWTAEPGPLVLRPGVTYTALGSQSRHDGANTFEVSFTAAYAANLAPGQVLFHDVFNESPSGFPAGWLEPPDTVITQEEFNRKIQDPHYC